MEVSSKKTFQVSADIDSVWAVLNDPEQVVVCVPGAQLTEALDEDHFKGKATLKIGPVTAKFNGKVEFTQRDSAKYELALEGKGADISGKGGASMKMSLSLRALEKHTEVTSIMSVSITGRIAQFGARMIEAVNNKLFEQFTQNFSSLLAQENGAADAGTNSPEAEPVKAASLVGSVIVSELKKKFGKKVPLQ
ncbi:MAG: SRPBCC family protein [SAR324 cluster bacterium]|nr:SRPBCC family protein [SAR324 cluster bacterium]